MGNDNLNKRQIKFLKYVSRPRKRSDVLGKFPKCRENNCLYDVNFSKYFDVLGDDTLHINNLGRAALSGSLQWKNVLGIAVAIFTIIGGLFTALSYLHDSLLVYIHR